MTETILGQNQFLNRYIKNQIIQEKQAEKLFDLTNKNKTKKEETKRSKIFYHDIYYDIPNVDRNALVTSTLATYNVKIYCVK